MKAGEDPCDSHESAQNSVPHFHPTPINPQCPTLLNQAAQQLNSFTSPEEIAPRHLRDPDGTRSTKSRQQAIDTVDGSEIRRTSQLRDR